jgi:hypothetical protein
MKHHHNQPPDGFDFFKWGKAEIWILAVTVICILIALRPV